MVILYKLYFTIQVSVNIELNLLKPFAKQMIFVRRFCVGGYIAIFIFDLLNKNGANKSNHKYLTLMTTVHSEQH